MLTNWNLSHKDFTWQHRHANFRSLVTEKGNATEMSEKRLQREELKRFLKSYWIWMQAQSIFFVWINLGDHFLFLFFLPFRLASFLLILCSEFRWQLSSPCWLEAITSSSQARPPPKPLLWEVYVCNSHERGESFFSLTTPSKDEFGGHLSWRADIFLTSSYLFFKSNVGLLSCHLSSVWGSDLVMALFGKSSYWNELSSFFL